MCDTLSLLYFSFPSCWPPCTAPSQRCHVIRALPYYSKAPSPVGPLSLTESLIMGHSHSCELILVCFTCLSLCALVRPLHFFWGSLNYSSLCHFHLLLLPFSLEFLKEDSTTCSTTLGTVHAVILNRFWGPTIRILVRLVEYLSILCGANASHLILDWLGPGDAVHSPCRTRPLCLSPGLSAWPSCDLFGPFILTCCHLYQLIAKILHCNQFCFSAVILASMWVPERPRMLHYWFCGGL